MCRKLFITLLITIFLSLESCGTIFKYKYIGDPISNKLDWGIIALDGIGIVLFVIPGIVAFTIDYMTGTIFLPGESIVLNNLSTEDMEILLKRHNIHITQIQLEGAKKIAFNL